MTDKEVTFHDDELQYLYQALLLARTVTTLDKYSNAKFYRWVVKVTKQLEEAIN